MHKLNTGIERLSQVVDEVIGASRIATNRLDLFFAPVQLGEVVNEIAIENAIKFTPDGGSITISAENKGGAVTLNETWRRCQAAPFIFYSRPRRECA